MRLDPIVVQSFGLAFGRAAASVQTCVRPHGEGGLPLKTGTAVVASCRSRLHCIVDLGVNDQRAWVWTLAARSCPLSSVFAWRALVEFQAIREGGAARSRLLVGNSLRIDQVVAVKIFGPVRLRSHWRLLHVLVPLRSKLVGLEWIPLRRRFIALCLLGHVRHGLPACHEPIATGDSSFLLERIRIHFVGLSLWA